MASMILALVFASLLCNTLPILGVTQEGIFLLKALVSIIILFVHQWWFSPEYKGALTLEISMDVLKKLFIPYLVMLVASYLCNLIDAGFVFHPTWSAIAIAIGAGFSEEITIRGVTIPIGMRYLKNKNKPLIFTLVTAILFGLVHLSSLAAGAHPTMVAFQVVTAICAGIFFASVFLRCGSILVTILMHGFYDWMCFVTDPTVSSGVMTATNITLGLVLVMIVDIALAIAGLYLIRPSVQEDIQAIWDKKWSQ